MNAQDKHNNNNDEKKTETIEKRVVLLSSQFQCSIKVERWYIVLDFNYSKKSLNEPKLNKKRKKTGEATM